MTNNNPRNKVSELQNRIVELEAELSDKNEVIQSHKEEMNQFVAKNRQKELDGNEMRRYSHCCNFLMHPFISLSMRMCLKCKKEYEWNLKDKQPALFQRNMD